MKNTVEKTEHEPDDVFRHGKTIVEIYGAKGLSEDERQFRHQAVVKAVADCIRSQFLSQKRQGASE